MTRVLLTAFEPYGLWPDNSSWLTLKELTQDLPVQPQITTRLYPVDFAKVRDRLTQDLARDYDFALHLGQAPGEAEIRLETVGLNVRDVPPSNGTHQGTFGPVVDGGPLAYQSDWPAAALAQRLRAAGMPARVSHHAGTYVCNATLYLSHYLAERMALRTRVGFVHLPLETSQIIARGESKPSLPAAMMATAIRELLGAIEELEEAEPVARRAEIGG
ncbi:MAG: pyroglutamyl-peptidase I [Planctomycetia bacterium]|nr:pyroglutamyl-peptidase I [Planctomycetia bacterium]